MHAPESRILPHEAFFGLFLAVTWARLVALGGLLDRDALFYFAHLALAAALVAWTWRCETTLRWRLRLLFYPVAMNLVFVNMKTAVPRLGEWRADALLQRIDHSILGGNLSLRIEPFVHPIATEFFSLCYLLFFPYLLFSLVYYLCAPLPLARRFHAGLFTIYGLGFLGYTFLPAAGPYVAMTADFTVPLAGGWFTHWNAAIVRAGSNGVDVFPSLHCAVSAFMLFFDRRHRPWRFKLYLLPCLGLWVSTIYLRYHYAIDCAAGFLLAGFALALTRRLFPADDHALHARIPESVRHST